MFWLTWVQLTRVLIVIDQLWIITILCKSESRVGNFIYFYVNHIFKKSVLRSFENKTFQPLNLNTNYWYLNKRLWKHIQNSSLIFQFAPFGTCHLRNREPGNDFARIEFNTVRHWPITSFNIIQSLWFSVRDKIVSAI